MEHDEFLALSAFINENVLLSVFFLEVMEVFSRVTGDVAAYVCLRLFG